MKEYSTNVRNELEALEFLGEVESRARGNIEFAQLDVKGILEKEDIRVFHKGHMIAFQIPTAGPEDSDLGAKRIQKNEALFKGVAASLLVK